MRTVINAREAPSWEAPTEDRRRFQILLDPEQSGSESVAMGHLYLPVGAGQESAETHANSEEIYYCAKGRGKLLLDNQEYELEPGTAAYVGRNVLHQVFNTGDEELLMLWFESPPSVKNAQYKPIVRNWKKIPGQSG